MGWYQFSVSQTQIWYLLNLLHRPGFKNMKIFSLEVGPPNICSMYTYFEHIENSINFHWYLTAEIIRECLMAQKPNLLMHIENVASICFYFWYVCKKESLAICLLVEVNCKYMSGFKITLCTKTNIKTWHNVYFQDMEQMHFIISIFTNM